MIKKVLFFVLLAALVLFFVNQKRELTQKPSPTPIPLPMEEFIASPSAYATDEAVLKIEKDLGILEKELDVVDLDELRLHPPLIDLNVEY